MLFNVLLSIYKWGFFLLLCLTVFVYSISQNWIATALCGTMAAFFALWYVIAKKMKSWWDSRENIKQHK